MEYLITESQYHYLKQILSEQEVVSDELTNKIIDEYQRLIESTNENVERLKEPFEKEFNDPKNFKYLSYSTTSKEWHDGYHRILKKLSDYRNRTFSFQPKVLIETIYKDLRYSRNDDKWEDSAKLYLIFNNYFANTKNRKKINNVFAKYNIKFEVKFIKEIRYNSLDFKIKNEKYTFYFNMFSVNFEKINPPITTTTTTEIQKTIMPEPYFDKNTERAVKAECDMTFVGKKGKTTFDRIHRTSDGKFLGDYDKSLSLDFNIRRFCKK
jgi:hypothetical protein